MDWWNKLELVASAFPKAPAEPGRELQTLNWVLERIHSARGAASIEALSREMGCSMRRLQRVFKTHIGLSPKGYSRIVRFEALCSLLRESPNLHWSDAAEILGYFDQPHLSR